VITVKRIAGGRVSTWLHDRVRAGDVIGLGPAQGDFILPQAPPNTLLLYSGGSGITPVMSILRDLDRRDLVSDVVFVHHARSRRDVIFAGELARIAARRPGLRIVLRLDDELDGAPPFDRAWLADTVPDFASRPTYLCGPAGLMAAVEDCWHRAGATGRLHREQFAAAPVTATATDLGRARVTLHRARRTVELDRNRPLLDALEAAGEQPAHGCRMGICNSCACRKRTGAVRNLTTGDISTEPDEQIRLCVSAPVSDLELEL
jgi:ferredoxin-NADP reductase